MGWIWRHRLSEHRRQILCAIQRDANAYSNSDTDSDIYPDADCYFNPNNYTGRYPYADTNSYIYSESDRNCHAYIYTDCYSPA